MEPIDLSSAIEKTRSELLELTARNRLIHTPLESKKPTWVRIVGEHSDSLFDLLVRQKKTLTFLPQATEEPTLDDASLESTSPTDITSLDYVASTESPIDSVVDDSALEVARFRQAFEQLSTPRTENDVVENDIAETDDNEELDPDIVDADELDELSAPQHDAGSNQDLFLQTTLTDEKLHDRLLKCFYEARTSVEEQGVSILYLACGFLKWRESPNSEVNRYAPLLLIPVELSRNNARSKFRLKFREDEIVTNLSIQARLYQDFGIRLPDIPESAADDELWSPARYFAQIQELLHGRPGWELLENDVLLWFFSFTKFLMFRDLSKDAWPAQASLENNPLLRALLSEGFREESSVLTCRDNEPIDFQLNPADVVHVTDADSSQAIVIHEIAQGRNLVVQGPPGTGKSQTITNAIAAAVHAGKTVLFVSEKMAALEVVKRRLDNLNLGPMILELHSHKSRKQEVLAELKQTLELGVPTSNRMVPVDELRQTVVQLREHDAALHTPIGNSTVSPYQAMGQLLRLREQNIQSLDYAVPQAAHWSAEEYQSRRQLAQELDKLLVQSGVPAQNPWHGANCAPPPPSELQRLQTLAQSLLSPLQELKSAAESMASLMQLPAPPHLMAVSESAQLAQHLLRIPATLDRSALTSARWDTELPALEKSLDNIARHNALLAELSPLVTTAGLSVDLQSTRQAIAAYGSSWLRIFHASYRQAMATLRGIMKAKLPPTAAERLALVDKIIEFQGTVAQLQQDQDRGQALLGTIWQGSQMSLDVAKSIVQWVKDAPKSKLAKEQLRKVTSQLADPALLTPPLQSIRQHLKTVDSGLENLAKQLALDPSVAFKADQVRTVPLAAWHERLAGWLAQPTQLGYYLSVMSRLNRLAPVSPLPAAATSNAPATSGLERFVSDVVSGRIAAGQVALQLDYLRYDAVLSAAWKTIPSLAEFQGQSYEELRNRFTQLDTERIELSRLQVAQKHHENFPNLSADSGQVAIVRREINKKRKHFPIRRLLKEAGHAIQKIKPVFMMSPLSVAQFLEPGAVEFDLLVIDEASQVQPVDALGAIARCKQLVVVGDQRQLPPTNFFGRMSGEDSLDDGEDHGTSAGDLESILGLCEAQGMPNRLLRWHYRSRHESLIAVSNRQFYENRLFIVPSPISGGGPLGLKLRFIEDGRYDRGGTRANHKEAVAIADAVMQHARHSPHLSLGVATFSSAQRDAILGELEKRRRADTSLEDFFATGGVAPFFVKSLENVQGDERDVIYISVGYAKDKDGYFSQNFGPLNRKGGERRLNVLISRAAAKCEVFTSIRAADIDLNRSQSEGVAALKLYLNYAETGRLELERALGHIDSDFEAQVASALRARGLEVDHQIGVGGFYIDLGIRDPENRGRYLMGIECDGAQYHNARWVRDRDRLRQQILESRGWHIHRIWSTDWFQRPEEEIERLLGALEHAKVHWQELDRQAAEASVVISGRLKPATEGTSATWLRLEVSQGSGAVVEGVLEYTEAGFELPDYVGSATNLTEPELRQVIQRILEVEAPIHVEELGRRIIKICGEGRMVASFKNKVSAAVQALAKASNAECHGHFVYRVGQGSVPVRSRRLLENSNLRKVELIAPTEIRAALLKVVTESIGTSVSETIASAAKLLGISNSQQVQALFAEELEKLSLDSLVEDRNGRLFVTT